MMPPIADINLFVSYAEMLVQKLAYEYAMQKSTDETTKKLKEVADAIDTALQDATPEAIDKILPIYSVTHLLAYGDSRKDEASKLEKICFDAWTKDNSGIPSSYVVQRILSKKEKAPGQEIKALKKEIAKWIGELKIAGEFVSCDTLEATLRAGLLLGYDLAPIDEDIKKKLITKYFPDKLNGLSTRILNAIQLTAGKFSELPYINNVLDAIVSHPEANPYEREHARLMRLTHDLLLCRS